MRRPATRRPARRAWSATGLGCRAWPKPHYVKTKPGDCVIVKHETPHSGTRVDGPDPRFMIYFRVIHAGRPEGFKLSYPDAMTNIWLEVSADVIADLHRALSTPAEPQQDKTRQS